MNPAAPVTTTGPFVSPIPSLLPNLSCCPSLNPSFSSTAAYIVSSASSVPSAAVGAAHVHLPFNGDRPLSAPRGVCAANLVGRKTSGSFSSSHNSERFPPTLIPEIRRNLNSRKRLSGASKGEAWERTMFHMSCGRVPFSCF